MVTLYVPTVLGISDSAAATAAARPVSEVVTDREVIRGRIVRVTSAYVLISRDTMIVTLPMRNVREIRRFFVESPAADFLDGVPAPGPAALVADLTASRLPD